MLEPGDVVVTEFRGASTTKRRPAIVVSTEAHHQCRPDVVLAVVTSKIPDPLLATDALLQDWADAGLRRPSAVRCYLGTFGNQSVRRVGHLSDRDWSEVRNCLAVSIAISPA